MYELTEYPERWQATRTAMLSCQWHSCVLPTDCIRLFRTYLIDIQYNVNFFKRQKHYFPDPEALIAFAVKAVMEAAIFIGLRFLF